MHKSDPLPLLPLTPLRNSARQFKFLWGSQLLTANLKPPSRHSHCSPFVIKRHFFATYRLSLPHPPARGQMLLPWGGDPGLEVSSWHWGEGAARLGELCHQQGPGQREQSRISVSRTESVQGRAELSARPEPKLSRYFSSLRA